MANRSWCDRKEAKKAKEQVLARLAKGPATLEELEEDLAVRVEGGKARIRSAKTALATKGLIVGERIHGAHVWRLVTRESEAA